MNFKNIEELFKRIEKLSLYSLTGEDMVKLTQGTAKIIIYNDLKTYSKIEELFDTKDAVIILYVYEIKGESVIGHWTCLFINRTSGLIEFFDPYGYYPDEERHFIPGNMWEKPYLTKLLYNSSLDKNSKIEFNEYDYQGKHDYDIATCGRWVGIRVLLKHLTNQQFHNLFYSPNKQENNFIITFLTSKFLGK